MHELTEENIMGILNRFHREKKPKDIFFTCQTCNQRFVVSDKYDGKETVCSNCGQALIVQKNIDASEDLRGAVRLMTTSLSYMGELDPLGFTAGQDCLNFGAKIGKLLLDRYEKFLDGKLNVNANMDDTTLTIFVVTKLIPVELSNEMKDFLINQIMPYQK
jgi:hypothetical protein